MRKQQRRVVIHRGDLESPKKSWQKPVLVTHGSLVDLTQAKSSGGTDSGLGTPLS